MHSTGWVSVFRHYKSNGTHRLAISHSTFLGIAIHNAASANVEKESIDLAAGVRQDANGLLGTTVQLSDLVSLVFRGLVIVN
jgi:hypothetical protein